MPISIYHGYEIKEIAENCSVYEARRYINELIILNEKNKSKLKIVSERSMEDASAMSKIQLSQLGNSIGSLFNGSQKPPSQLNLNFLASSLKSVKISSNFQNDDRRIQSSQNLPFQSLHYHKHISSIPNNKSGAYRNKQVQNKKRSKSSLDVILSVVSIPSY